jgi:hypothetical protein
MHGAAGDEYAEAVYDLVVKALAELDEEAEARPDGVRLKKWPTVRIYVEREIEFPNDGDYGTWLGSVDLTWRYNDGLPFTAARSHMIGHGPDCIGALKDAVDIWAKGLAPTLISYMYGVVQGESDTAPGGHERALSGWSTIKGPYVLRGAASKTAALSTFLQTHPLLVEPVRARLAVALGKSDRFHTISLYRGVAPSGTFADVLIDNHLDEDASELLKNAHWPEWITDTPFLSVRQFLLCIAPNEGEQRTESWKLLH